MQAISTQWQNNKTNRDQILKSTQQHRDQMRQGLQALGTKLQQSSQDLLAKKDTQALKEQFQTMGSKLTKLNFGGGSDQAGLTDQLEMFNERMKEEALRRDVRREAEEACLQSMREHLEEFLQGENGDSKTYEEWIFAFHPENTQDATLLQDMEYKEVDLRFYVEESDHRRLWNEMVRDAHRQVAARTRVFGGSKAQQEQPVVDLLGVDSPSGAAPTAADPFEDNNTESVASNGALNTTTSATSLQEADLISF